jgi:hypothetical protein
MIRASLLILLALASPFVYAGDFVGNSGDGVWIGGRLVVRDLLQAGLSDSYWIGKEENARLSEQLAVMAGPVREAAPPLARKLADLERTLPGFAEFLLGSLRLYNLAIVEQPLTKEPLGGGVIDFPEEDRVQLATRVFRTIYLHGPSWRALHPDQRAALILHELIGSLMKPERSPDGFEMQPSLRTRQIVAALFSPELERQGRPFLDNELRTDLDLPWEQLRRRPLVNQWKLTLRHYRPDNIAPREELFHAGQVTWEEAAQRAQDLCNSLEGAREPWAYRILSGEVVLREWEARFEEYQSSTGKQLRLVIRGTLVKHPHYASVSNQDGPGACRAMVDDQLRRFSS